MIRWIPIFIPVTDEDGFAGYDVTYKNEGKTFTAIEATAMFLTKLKDITEAWIGRGQTGV